MVITGFLVPDRKQRGDMWKWPAGTLAATIIVLAAGRAAHETHLFETESVLLVV